MIETHSFCLGAFGKPHVQTLWDALEKLTTVRPRRWPPSAGGRNGRQLAHHRRQHRVDGERAAGVGTVSL